MSLAPGTRLGSYEIEAPLGKGAMGEVYRARDLKLGREVAVKLLPGAFASDPERVRRFEQEALAASALNHPNIVHIYDIGRTEDAGHYIVMELVEGRTLRAVLAEAPLSCERLAELGRQIADGLAKAHAAGITHRDLKPENVMVTPEDFVKILDFGLAKLSALPFEVGSEMATVARGGTRHGMLIGTVEYMSPEQAAGRAVDPRSDQFALGLILYEMATGRRAFQRETAAQTLASIIESEPRPLREVNPRSPSELDPVVRRCLEKRPEDRYPDTRELAGELKALGRGEARTPRPLPPPRPALPERPSSIGGYVRGEIRGALDEVGRELNEALSGESLYHVRGERGRERTLSESRLRRGLRRRRYSGVEMVRREGEEVFRPLEETPLYERELARRDRSDRSRVYGLGRHLVAFVCVGSAFTFATGQVPDWLGFWGIGVAMHTFGTLPSLFSVFRGRRALAPQPNAAELPAESPLPELLPATFVEEVGRVRDLLKRRGGGDVADFLKEVDGIVARVTELASMRRDLEEQTSTEERDRLRKAEAEAKAKLREASSVQDRKLYERHLDVLAQRLGAIDKALAVVQRLALRQEMAEHQVKQLRLDLSRGEASSASAPELTSRLQDIRHEVDAIEQVDEALAKELLS